MIEQQLLTIIIPVSMKTTLVDVLMAYESISGFTMTKVAGFSRQHSQYSIQEQVVGYKDFYRIEVVLENTQVNPLLRHLCQFKDRYPLRYWLLPLTDAGVIDRESDCISLDQEDVKDKERQ
jgi:nitrogen regulatory protein PII